MAAELVLALENEASSEGLQEIDSVSSLCQRNQMLEHIANPVKS